MTALIEFEQVAKSFATGGQMIAAIERVDLTVKRGEFVTLVGPSGCGKSTLLNMAAGLFEPTRGVVRYDGQRVPRFNQRTGYMTQNDHLLPWRTVEDNIAIPLEIAGWPRKQMGERIGELIRMVGLGGFEKSYPVQLSGGMRKRCALARLLAYDPETLLLDEPFAALDAQLRLRMQMELLEICHRLHKTVLFVTHDLDEAAALADRVVVFSGRPGTIVSDVDSTLPRDRDVMNLRRDPAYIEFTAGLWDLLAPAVEQAQ
ncbi:ABC transporter ATP-binding protein [Mesorhizobium sp. 8]|uniref:ABC transporter ATP-binding protein n=1 Tax=Mesorhizobium sp. 8 TaxID=2584466 RepID=UPI00111F46E2|nr:ABC transporter ATP-binding protein [Mesorhizobium sp. 8]QDC00999.1 ABC transporter ATP-binding protein [Mesorhizobium sp. 8]